MTRRARYIVSMSDAPHKRTLSPAPRAHLGRDPERVHGDLIALTRRRVISPWSPVGVIAHLIPGRGNPPGAHKPRAGHAGGSRRGSSPKMGISARSSRLGIRMRRSGTSASNRVSRGLGLRTTAGPATCINTGRLLTRASLPPCGGRVRRNVAGLSLTAYHGRPWLSQRDCIARSVFGWGTCKWAAARRWSCSR